MTNIKTEKFARKPFLIDAIRVTDDNMAEVAKWCKGEVLEEQRGIVTVNYIRVNVSRPLNERQKKAYAGDWVLFAGRGFKCYSAKAFDDCFERPGLFSTVTCRHDQPSRWVDGELVPVSEAQQPFPQDCLGVGE